MFAFGHSKEIANESSSSVGIDVSMHQTLKFKVISQQQFSTRHTGYQARTLQFGDASANRFTGKAQVRCPDTK
jgi:hypothetical protein